MTRSKRATIYVATALSASLLASVSDAADLSPIAPAPVQLPSGWTYTITPYFWTPGISGNVGVHGLPEAHVDVDFDEIWDNLDFGVMAAGEARYERYSVVGDAIYLKLSNDTATPRGIDRKSVV